MSEIARTAKLLEEQTELTARLRSYADAYYNNNQSPVSDHEYDILFDRLQWLESQTGQVLEGSVTQTVGAVTEAVSELKKVRHEEKMLSLDKTKHISKLASWLGKRTGCLSWKMDGLTLVLTYENGRLQQAVTRGTHGEIGDDVTHNAKYIHGIPAFINHVEKLVVRGEAVMLYEDFYAVKNTPEGKEYKNARNLCSSTVRSLDPALLKIRNVWFYAFELVTDTGENSFIKKLEYCRHLGINTVHAVLVTSENLEQVVNDMKQTIGDNPFPSDGLVLQHDDVVYGKSLGATSHHPNCAIAFKWQDKTKETTLREIEWSTGGFGTLTPVAIFDAVKLEGTSVSRATIHNVDILSALKLHIGDRISVYKSNMIIPEIAENLDKSDDLVYNINSEHDIFPVCPKCGTRGVIKNGFAYCPNELCIAKLLGKFERLSCKDALDIRGLSSETLTLLIKNKFLQQPEDIFRLKSHSEIQSLPGFGKRKFEKLIAAIDFAKSHAELYRVLYAMMIPNIGRSASRDICNKYASKLSDNPESLAELTHDELVQVEGVGPELAQSFTEWFSVDANKQTFKAMLFYVNTETPVKPDVALNPNIADKTFVVTGSVYKFKNRNELKTVIESCGGKVAGSVSKNTSYLINNDTTSESSKNKKAHDMGIPIISEDDFIEMLNQS